MSENQPQYHYHSAVEELALWVAAHRNHFVIASGPEWLRCMTCAEILRISDGRRAGAVLRDEFGR